MLKRPLHNLTDKLQNNRLYHYGIKSFNDGIIKLVSSIIMSRIREMYIAGTKERLSVNICLLMPSCNGFVGLFFGRMICRPAGLIDHPITLPKRADSGVPQE